MSLSTNICSALKTVVTAQLPNGTQVRTHRDTLVGVTPRVDIVLAGLGQASDQMGRNPVTSAWEFIHYTAALTISICTERGKNQQHDALVSAVQGVFLRGGQLLANISNNFEVLQCTATGEDQAVDEGNREDHTILNVTLDIGRLFPTPPPPP